MSDEALACRVDAAWQQIDSAPNDRTRRAAEHEYRRLRALELASRTTEERAADQRIDDLLDCGENKTHNAPRGKE